MRIQILVDNPTSWFVPYALKLNDYFVSCGYESSYINDVEQVIKGDVLCLLSCEKIFKNLHLNNYNLVVHSSDLPKGKGMSPLTWQIIEGKNEIVNTLIEASYKIDNGPIYLQNTMRFEGHELIDEIRIIQGESVNELIKEFIQKIDVITPQEQVGEETIYRKRKLEDSEIDITKSISAQFNKLRVVDNERYPAFFVFNGIKYKLKISKFDI
jgi:methionyl-tRNA formyltransferase